MQNSTYYNLKLVKGTDTVNPLIVDVPNYEIIDEQMHNNAVAGVGFATELANGSSHAITRENSECSAFRFIATANWKLGDSVSVDGVPVTTLLPSGETLPEGAYVINANVLCILTGTNLTVYADRKKVDKALEIEYNDTNVEMELNKLNSKLAHSELAFTPLDKTRYGVNAHIINGVLYLRAYVKPPAINALSSLTIGTINDWTEGERITICPVVSMGEDERIMSARIVITGNGTVEVRTEGKISGNQWLYGNTATVL